MDNSVFDHMVSLWTHYSAFCHIVQPAPDWYYPTIKVTKNAFFTFPFHYNEHDFNFKMIFIWSKSDIQVRKYRILNKLRRKKYFWTWAILHRNTCYSFSYVFYCF